MSKEKTEKEFLDAQTSTGAKGIYQQMEEASKKVISSEPLTLKRLTEVLDEMAANRIEQIKEDKIRIEENYAHLEARSRELGKPIPVVLMMLMCTAPQPMVSSDMLETYKEWL